MHNLLDKPPVLAVLYPLSNKMTAPNLLFTCVIVFFWTLLLSSFLHAIPAYPTDDSLIKVSATDSQKVNLSLYYDTLCPFCATFIVKNLTGVFYEDLINIINLRLVPWGNSYINKSSNGIVCQHGPDECILNILEACAIDVLQNVNKHYALIYCFEFLAIEGRQKDWKSCFTSLGLPKKPVLDCYISGNGTKLVQKYADETARLNPPHTFVPWVVVNNHPLQEEYQNFAAYICKAYKGNGAPEVCKSLVTQIN
ncbi:gamma-interferon-responsive lysosomal thiol protein-like [Juglans microcarpa x Juglans regia]|uniref:gamma-interferon-responsive lysosomal thiol protein-like n=1 Tax=Juglans microcarpa x Juglans regia TaxID=2249226 RepID=UPI001B7DE025|nr:gamma-interferon-responsive lysosomal thiol protein-like [Juglans microcarpa x Juglans regia]